jgi:hypothetical protein
VRARLYAHALRTARPRQLRARAARVLTRRLFPDGPPPQLRPLAGPVGLWRSRVFAPAPLAGEGTERLRSFHRHYGEDVLAAARAGDAAAAASAARRWIAGSPPRPGDAWHPYTTATRAGNWIAALSLEPAVAGGELERSLWRQLRHLALNVEDDVLGNHVVRNARALVLGGLAFDDERLLEQGLALLERELPEQVLSDGGHYERSPTYHLVVLRDLLEIEAARPGSVAVPVIERMRGFAAALARPDGGPALFNDGGADLAPELDLPSPGEGLSLFPETGYAVWRRGPLWLAFDCGPPAPPYLPAHAHADALSFQLWWGPHAIVVDPGTFTYEAGSERDWFRGTAAHATVALDGRDQFELWGAFRSGPFPPVELVEATPERLAARVRLAGAVHTRTLLLGGDELEVVDELDGRGEHRLLSSLPLGVRPPERLRATGPLEARPEERWRSERFFLRERGAALAQRGVVRLPATLGWRIALGT